MSELIKLVMYDFLCHYVKPTYEEKAKLLYVDTDIIIVYRKQMIFAKTLKKILKQDLILQAVNYTDHYENRKIKK